MLLMHHTLNSDSFGLRLLDIYEPANATFLNLNLTYTSRSTHIFERIMVHNTARLGGAASDVIVAKVAVSRAIHDRTYFLPSAPSPHSTHGDSLGIHSTDS
jgi:hypothetical protein